MFKSGKLAVRRLLAADAPLLVRWLSDPEVLRYYEGRDRPHDMEMVRKHFYEDREEITPCIILYDGQAIGYLQFYPLSHEDQAQYGIKPTMNRVFGMDQFIGETAYWGKGIGTKLIKTMVNYLIAQHQAVRIMMDPQTWNERALHVYEKCGFRKLALLPKHEYHEGEMRDCWLIAYDMQDGGRPPMQKSNPEDIEYIDTFTDAMKPAGVRTRHEVHTEGLWHQTFHCWLWMQEQGTAYLLLQRRHIHKKDYPNMLDITSAGHLEAGETPQDGVRELREELGIEPEPGKLVYAGVIADSIMQPDMTDNEFCHVFFYRHDGAISDFRLQEDEVDSIVRVEAEAFRKLCLGEADSAAAEEFSRGHGERGTGIKLTMMDIVPHEPAYFTFVLHHLQSLID